MPTRGSINIEDYSKEPTTSLFWLQDVGAGNYAGVTQDLDDIKDAILTVILGEVRDVNMLKSFPESAAAVTDKTAQREFKWRYIYRDTLQFLDAGNTIANPGWGKTFDGEIGTADPDLVANNTDYMDLTAGVGLAFKTAFDANVRSPYNHTSAVAGNKVDLLEMRLVGKGT